MIQVKSKVPADQDVQLQKLHARLICLPWHQGRHHASYSAMLAAASLGVSEATALPIIAHYMKRAGRSPEVGELERQWPNAKTHVSQTSGTDSSKKTTPSRKPVLYDGDFLRAFIKPLDVVSDIESYLKERSPLSVDTGPGEYLSTIFPSPEKSVFFNNLMSRGWLHPDEDIPDLISYFQPVAPEGCEAVRNETGMWYLCQPVNGEERINSSGKSSIRSEENVVSFKHLVIESDIGKQHPEQPELWLRAAALLKLPIVSIVKSGNPRSGAHILVKVNAKSKEEWQVRKDLIKFSPLLGRLGADPAIYSAVRLTRLANVPRPDKGGFQTLLYFNPEPTGRPIYSL